MASTISALGLGDEALKQAFRRVAFNVVARNCDDHTKNFGFLLKDGGVWALASAYDVTHAHNPNGEWTSQHLMSVNGRFDGITAADLLVIAERFSVPGAPDALKDVGGVVGTWMEFAREAEVSPAEADRVAADFQVLA